MSEWIERVCLVTEDEWRKLCHPRSKSSSTDYFDRDEWRRMDDSSYNKEGMNETENPLSSTLHLKFGQTIVSLLQLKFSVPQTKIV